MDRLSRSVFPAYPVKVMQFGEGNFLRAFVDWMVNEMNKKGLFGGMVRLVQPLENGLADLINEQNGLYTLVLRGMENGKPVERHEVIECVKDCLNPYREWEAVADCARGEALRFVFSNTTEAGIEYKPEPYTPGKCQGTYPAKLTSLLFERYRAGRKGLIIIPCELIDHNGVMLKKYILQYAADWNLPAEFREWIERENQFLCTLVDRIVAGYPRAEAAQMEEKFGYRDNLIDCGEIFHFFVMEGPKSVLEELPLDKAGLNVVVTDDQSPYRTRKVRFLNGAHTADVPASILGGLSLVDEMMDDPEFGAMTRKAVYEEIFPTVDLPSEEKKFFADSIVERFRNPFARHRLLSISLNSISKWKVRVMPTLLDFVERTGKLPDVLAFSMAALIQFYSTVGGKGKTDTGVEYQVSDSPEVVAFFENALRSSPDTPDYVTRVLGNLEFWGRDLNSVPGLTGFVSRKLELIRREGVRAAVKTIL